MWFRRVNDFPIEYLLLWVTYEVIIDDMLMASMKQYSDGQLGQLIRMSIVKIRPSDDQSDAQIPTSVFRLKIGDS
jgi:hypothetical protein